MKSVRDATRAAQVLRSIPVRLEAQGPKVQGRVAIMSLINSDETFEYFELSSDQVLMYPGSLAEEVETQLYDMGYQPNIVTENGNYFLVI